MRILFTLINLLLILVNLYFTLYFYWLKEYKINKTIPKFYSYILLDNEIKTISEKIEWQNILTEKWWIRIIKEQNYLLTKDSILSWELILEKKIGNTSQKVKKTVTNQVLLDIYQKNKDLVSFTVTHFWENQISKLLILDKQTILNILQDTNEGNSWSFNILY